MKNDYRQISLSRICRLLGITRQGYHQYFWLQQSTQIEHELVLQKVQQIRKRHPYIGGRKLHKLLNHFLLEHSIKMGRDALFELLQLNHLLVRRRQRKRTTNSFHRFHKYPNLIKSLSTDTPNQLWVSDITYWKIDPGFVYVSLVTDAYSRKIVGYHVADNLDTIQTIQAVRMAIKSLEKKPLHLIHHSDRGFQYCSNEYVKILQDNCIQISMTENGDPRENAIAERVNGILKEEYLNSYSVKNLEHAKIILNETIQLYNKERPHMSCNYKTPNQVHLDGQLLKYG